MPFDFIRAAEHACHICWKLWNPCPVRQNPCNPLYGHRLLRGDHPHATVFIALYPLAAAPSNAMQHSRRSRGKVFTRGEIATEYNGRLVFNSRRHFRPRLLLVRSPAVLLQSIQTTRLVGTARVVAMVMFMGHAVDSVAVPFHIRGSPKGLTTVATIAGIRSAATGWGRSAWE